MFYGIALGPLRFSLCLTLLEFASGKRIRQVIHIMVALNIVAAIVYFASVMTICRLCSAQWHYFYDFPRYPKKGGCFNGTGIHIYDNQLHPWFDRRCYPSHDPLRLTHRPSEEGHGMAAIEPGPTDYDSSSDPGSFYRLLDFQKRSSLGPWYGNTV